MSANEIAAGLATRAEDKLKQSGRNRILITLAGIPGSGKSTTAAEVINILGKRGIKAIAVGMDGYHYTKVELAERIGEEKAVKFRGAPYTFDAPGVLALAHVLAHPPTNGPVLFPTFDHSKKDPVPNDGAIPADTQVVVFEGNYLHLDEPQWRDIMPLAADTWFASVALDVARQRLAKRHVASGIVSTLEEGEERADNNDIPNGLYILEHSRPAAVEFITG